MQAINTQNQYYAQNFQGNISTYGVNLSKRTMAQVNKLFADKTNGLPDVVLMGENGQNSEGKFFHSVHFIQGGTDFAAILTRDLKTLFREETPENLADMFATLSKRAAKDAEVTELRKELKSLENKLAAVSKRARAQREGGDIVMAERNEAIAQRMTNKYETLQGKIDNAEFKLKRPLRCIGDWIM